MHMCWLASFPRSGNTWVRNIFYEVFGLESGTWDVSDKGHVHEPDCFLNPIVKTHMLPSQLIHDSAGKKAVYLVRDGRDAMVSIAHHRSDIVAPGSDLMDNMRAAILAEKGSFFGGWSGNVERWMERADLVVRYEDLLVDAPGTLERVRLLLNLPEGDYSKIPRFETLKRGLPRYGSRGAKFPEEERRAHSGRFFRRGKSGAWLDEMPPDLHDLFWSIHGDTMLKMGYRYDGKMESTPDPDLDWEVARLMGQPVVAAPARVEVIIEANDLISPAHNAAKRYLTLLLRELMHVQRNPNAAWDFHLFAKGCVLSPMEAHDTVANSFKDAADCLRSASGSSSRPPPGEPAPENPAGTEGKGGRRTFKRLLKFLKQSKRPLRAFFLSIGSRLQSGEGDRAGFAAEFIEGFSENHVLHLSSLRHYTRLSRARSPIVFTFRGFFHPSHPKSRTKAEGKNIKKTWNFALKKKAPLITTTQAEKKEASRLAGDRIPLHFVIPEAIERARFHRKVNREERRSVCKKYGIPSGKPFFFTYSSMAPCNALENTLRAFMELVRERPGANVMLVVGGAGAESNLDFRRFPKCESGKVCFTGSIQEEDLPFLLSEALALCHASALPDHDLPLLEALNCGTPVIYGNSPSLLEIVRDAGLPVPPSNPRELSLQMWKILTDAELRSELQGAALRQAARFSIRKSARETMDCYQETFKQSRRT